VLGKSGENPARTRHCDRGWSPARRRRAGGAATGSASSREGAGDSSPGARRPTSGRHEAHTPSWKGVALLSSKTRAAGVLAAGLLSLVPRARLRGARHRRPARGGPNRARCSRQGHHRRADLQVHRRADRPTLRRRRPGRLHHDALAHARRRAGHRRRAEWLRPDRDGVRLRPLVRHGRRRGRRVRRRHRGVPGRVRERRAARPRSLQRPRVGGRRGRLRLRHRQPAGAAAHRPGHRRAWPARRGPRDGRGHGRPRRRRCRRRRRHGRGRQRRGHPRRARPGGPQGVPARSHPLQRRPDLRHGRGRRLPLRHRGARGAGPAAAAPAATTGRDGFWRDRGRTSRPRAASVHLRPRGQRQTPRPADAGGHRGSEARASGRSACACRARTAPLLPLRRPRARAARCARAAAARPARCRSPSARLPRGATCCRPRCRAGATSWTCSSRTAAATGWPSRDLQRGSSRIVFSVG
jgi:hypothetical protein